jgi:predicted NAD/FAD-binding protein
MLLPWAASLAAGDIEEARGYSARAVMVFAAKALPPSPLDPVKYFVLRPGLAEVITRLIEQTTTVEVLTNAQVRQVAKRESGQFLLRCADGRARLVDDLILGASGPASVRLLDQMPGFEAHAGALRSIGFYPARLALHRVPAFAALNPAFRSFLNCQIEGAFCEASMSMEDVIADAPTASTSRLWKSWVSHRDAPARPLYETSYRHVTPAASTMGALDALRLLQGVGGVWIAGGYTREFDSQESALLSAMDVASGLGLGSGRLARLEAV